MLNGAITLYKNPDFLEIDKKWLRQNGYEILQIQCDDMKGFRQQVGPTLKFQENFGYDQWQGSLDALRDAFSMLCNNDQQKVALCLHNFHGLEKTTLDRKFAHDFLDVFEASSRNALLQGYRLIGLVQTRDPKTVYHQLGGRSTCWNQKEWLNKDRGL